MPNTLFSPTSLPVLTNPLGIGRAKCGLCKLNRTCNSPLMAPSGRGRRKILIIGEAPGQTEDDRGTQFCGKTGVELERKLARAGIDMRRDCTLTNALICHPPDNIVKDEKAIEYCRPNLIKTVRDVDAEVIVPVGAKAVQSLIGWLWGQEDTGPMVRWAGYQIPCQELNAWICPTWHPAFYLREHNPVVELQLERHLKAMSKLKGRPWDKVPDYESMVEPIFSVREAALRLKDVKQGTIAFDYESNCLKPEYEGAKIYSCSVCYNGKWTIAFPWDGEVIPEMIRIFKDKRILKRGSNIKFEHRWTEYMLKTVVRGWRRGGDTMLTAHGQENATKQRLISSVKFQAFVKLGQKDWSLTVAPYLKSTRGHINRIKEIAGTRELLVYNGMDSLIEYLVSEIQEEGMDND